MKLEIINTSVVVLAKHHNPTILHPSFLASEGIVPQDWDLAEPTVSTPVFAIVKYNNGIVFNVEENRFQVTDNEIKGDVRNSQVANLACKYIQKLPHVHYQATGFNFKGFVENDKPKLTLRDYFLKSGVADFNGEHPDALGLRLIYKLPDVHLRLSFDSGNVKHPDSEKERIGILVDANYHIEMTSNNIIEEIEKATSTFSNRCDHFIKIIANILKLEA